jgi:type IX secretion system PorP/SprF family membrane protein
MGKYRTFIIICGLFFFNVCKAQQEVLYSQYFFSQLAINPAYAGNDDNLNFTGLSKKQWLGIDGSPTTFSFIGHSPLFHKPSTINNYSGTGIKQGRGFSDNNQVGLGLVLCNDHEGVDNTFISSFAYSYKILFNEVTRLSFGLQASILNFRQSFNQIDNLNTLDPVFQDNVSVTKFNVGSGVFYETVHYYVGLSVPEIIENKLTPKNASGESQLRQYFLTGGYVFYLSRLFKFKPTLLLRYTESMPAQFDLSANFLYRDKIWAGISYRYNNSVNIIGELLISQKLRLGIAYDYPLSKIHLVTNGSAEIMISYTFQKVKHRIINPRYF